MHTPILASFNISASLYPSPIAIVTTFTLKFRKFTRFFLFSLFILKNKAKSNLGTIFSMNTLNDCRSLDKSSNIKIFYQSHRLQPINNVAVWDFPLFLSL